jgi:hypothetical protein
MHWFIYCRQTAHSTHSHCVSRQTAASRRILTHTAAPFSAPQAAAIRSFSGEGGYVTHHPRVWAGWCSYIYKSRIYTAAIRTHTAARNCKWHTHTAALLSHPLQSVTPPIRSFSGPHTIAIRSPTAAPCSSSTHTQLLHFLTLSADPPPPLPPERDTPPDCGQQTSECL